MSVNVIRKLMKHEEASRELGRKARQIRGKGAKEPILRVTIEDENGNEKELNSLASMVAAITASNEKRQKQCEGTPFMT